MRPARRGPPGRPRRPHRTAFTARQSADPPTDPTIAALRRVVDGLATSTHQVGELMLGVALAYLSDTAAVGVLAPSMRRSA
ncbi:hypothetical protein TUE45_pSRTUE45b_0099 (plasmid) [Streptomyces reticuli]|nr:hypothetical protein TUE45_pSRTUE45b_0099 [Streptomyces reticuli]